jgi:hypothetical protein
MQAARASGADAAGWKQPLHPDWNNKNNSGTTAKGRKRRSGRKFYEH